MNNFVNYQESFISTGIGKRWLDVLKKNDVFFSRSEITNALGITSTKLDSLFDTYQLMNPKGKGLTRMHIVKISENILGLNLETLNLSEVNMSQEAA